MRKRDPHHDRRLTALISATADECKRHIAVTDYLDKQYVPSEVLASIVRARFGKTTGVLDVASSALHRRVLASVSRQVALKPHWRALGRKDSEIVAEAASYFWCKLLRDTQPVCNAEVRFAVYLENRVDDYMRHLLAEKNTMPSVDDMSSKDEDGGQTTFISTVEDSNAETPEEAAMRRQLSTKMMGALMALAQKERNAFYFRIECKYDWKTVAELLGCSIPTAREYVRRSLEKLQGVCDE